MALEKVRRFLDSVIALDVDKIINQILSDKEFQQWMIELNTKGQLFNQGINSLGVKLSDIGGDYSPVTIEISKKKGRPKFSESHIDLHDTGKYYKTFKIVITKTEVNVISDPDKGDNNLYTDWGKDIVGWTDEHKQQIFDAIKERFLPVFKKQLAA